MDFEVHEIFIETAESLNVWAVNFNAVVGGADGFTVVYPQTGAVCGYLRKLAPLRKNGWRQFRPRRVNEVLLFSDSLSEPTTVLSEHVAPSSDDELAWRLFLFVFIGDVARLEARLETGVTLAISFFTTS
ncbi:hypothetical protein EVAR_17431_1 [Eumeta japonica]|uniref:Uncharacterized protein n=1 Tax=Eumeta variegata TaxID=151549 RepID=A0A4C1VAA1_EUMVA|nr:hypothetical protein EVAR_17431_1 [Eumeta japonica]